MPVHAPWLRRTCATALAAGLLLSGSAAAVPRHERATKSADLVTFGLGPSDGAKVDGRPYFYYAAAAGAVIKDNVIVLNYSTHDLRLQLYATDGYNGPDGSNNLLQAGEAPKDLGSWVRLRTPRRIVDVPGRAAQTDPPGKLVVPFQLAVPRNAAAGDHVAGMVVALRTYATNKQGLSIPLDQRVATQIYLRVAGDLHPALRIENLKAEYVDNWNPFRTGKVKLSYTVHNVGNVRLGAKQRVGVSGLIGSWRSPELPDVPLLLPGGKAHVETVVHGVWPEIWMPGTARVSALKLQTDVNPPTRGASASRHFWAIPWTLLALLFLAWLAYRSVKRWAIRRSKPGGAGPGGPADPEPTPPPHTPRHLRPERAAPEPEVLALIVPYQQAQELYP